MPMSLLICLSVYDDDCFTDTCIPGPCVSQRVSEIWELHMQKLDLGELYILNIFS
jgi:hypothetical protein